MISKELRRKMRLEFTIMINRCGCSKASIHISKKEAEENREIGLKEHEPSCTPKKCFPSIYSLLYPKGGFRTISYLVENFRKRKKNEL